MFPSKNIFPFRTHFGMNVEKPSVKPVYRSRVPRFLHLITGFDSILIFFAILKILSLS